MEKTYSQKVARVFEIICYLLLIPTILSLIYPFLMIIGGLASGRLEVLLFALIPFAIPIIGVVLLVGYFKHSRGYLDEEKISALWITTAVYNFLLLLPCLYYVSYYLQSQASMNAYGYENESVFSGYFIAMLSIVSGYISAIIFSLKAYSSEKHKNILFSKMNSPLP